MLQIFIIELESTMIESMYHLMGKRTLRPSHSRDMVLTNRNPHSRMKPSVNTLRTWGTVNWGRTADFLQFRIHKDNYRGFLEESVNEIDTSLMLILVTLHIGFFS